MRFSIVSVLAVATLAMAETSVTGSMSILPVKSSMVMTTAPYPTGGMPTGIPGTGTGTRTPTGTHNTTSTIQTSTRTGSGPSSTISQGLAATAGPAIAGVVGGAAMIAAFL